MANPFVRALGALTLGGVAVALAGCTGASAPKAGAEPAPELRAAAATKGLFAAFVVPPGARKLAGAPSADGGALKSTIGYPGVHLADKVGWWLAPGTPSDMLAWEKQHLSHRFSPDITGSAGTVEENSYTRPGGQQLLVQAVWDGQQTAIRVDAEVFWIPSRPASEQVPPTAKAVTISEALGPNQGNARPPAPVTVTDLAKVRQLVALINSLPLSEPGAIIACPLGSFDTLTLTFRAGPGMPALAVATDSWWVCGGVDLTIDGKHQPGLAPVSGQRIAKIAGLPWKLPPD